MQQLYFFFDDSGVLHEKNNVQKFIYAGYVFHSRQELDSAKRKYKALVKRIKEALGREDELKAFGLDAKYKRALYNVLKEEESLSLVVDISRVYDSILSSSRSICRYKDYILKRAIKAKIKSLLDSGTVLRTEEISISVFIDEQLTATDGIYGLCETIREELQFGIKNYDYEKFYPPMFGAPVHVRVEYCESKLNYMIQACDILANRIFSSYKYSKPELRKIPNHTHLTFP